jgi:hypothetical protein
MTMATAATKEMVTGMTTGTISLRGWLGVLRISRSQKRDLGGPSPGNSVI